MVMTDCQVFADALAIAWKKTSFQSGTHMLFTYFSNVSFPTSSSTVLYTPFFTATSLTISFAIALASGLPNVHMFESTITKLSPFFLAHVIHVLYIYHCFISNTFSGVSKSIFSLVSFRLGETEYVHLGFKVSNVWRRHNHRWRSLRYLIQQCQRHFEAPRGRWLFSQYFTLLVSCVFSWFFCKLLKFSRTFCECV